MHFDFFCKLKVTLGKSFLFLQPLPSGKTGWEECNSFQTTHLPFPDFIKFLVLFSQSVSASMKLTVILLKNLTKLLISMKNSPSSTSFFWRRAFSFGYWFQIS